MSRIVILPMLWMTIATAGVAATEVHGEDSVVTMGLFLSGIVGTAGLIWYTRGERDRIINKLDRIERILMLRPCLVDEIEETCQSKQKELKHGTHRKDLDGVV